MRQRSIVRRYLPALILLLVGLLLYGVFTVLAVQALDRDGVLLPENTEQAVEIVQPGSYDVYHESSLITAVMQRKDRTPLPPVNLSLEGAEGQIAHSSASADTDTYRVYKTQGEYVGRIYLPQPGEYTATLSGNEQLEGALRLIKSGSMWRIELYQLVGMVGGGLLLVISVLYFAFTTLRIIAEQLARLLRYGVSRLQESYAARRAKKPEPVPEESLAEEPKKQLVTEIPAQEKEAYAQSEENLFTVRQPVEQGDRQNILDEISKNVGEDLDDSIEEK